ncbi:hypothetical protein EJ05DRAFT_491840 [Pseudovirgaria hyperparasitica]|uniref:DUF7918 domain-containing protein n=1 Tax=Pseudovirgaria hyperparasitica TaxID=470096 RepID=A0A6A6WG18_9PEZI|nr:uncharacterized protein EJ05DRAFT_491840 [Pseudovirgaria hyperparasitica]KAF2761004.1 hypothetical protein EJ05DRAFT_491840 [Pseudovirgaria hyperparasitica]
MPCFQGLAVSIHTPDGPLSEYSIQRQNRFSRITSYIPVPPAKIPPGSNKPEQSTFAISITLLTPGLNVPYSAPKATADDPYPRPRIVGSLPGFGKDRGKYGPVIGPYTPLTQSPNETIAAYIYFDGRAKEEVATLLRRGEETWVNSRWVSVPDSEGGGLAEREFLFREVGLERWLNGLDLEGKDIAARIERRKQRLEKKRLKKDAAASDDEVDVKGKKPLQKNGVLRYGDNKDAPVESLSGDEGLLTSDSDSEDEPPEPEAAGQIKVALFRVLASGEIKRGEYSPQFDAHDDDENAGQNGNSGGDADVDHTTSFAKPKTLDPKSISTQTVTGIDPPDKPYAVFTFLYRGEKQLRKMGILATDEKKAPVPLKRRSTGIDLGNLKPLTSTGTKGFAGYRDGAATSPTKGFPRKGKKKDDEDAMDSDADDEDDRRNEEDYEDITEEKGLLSPDDALKQGELAEGVRKIKSTSVPAPTSTTTSSSAPNSGAPTPSLPPSDVPPEALVGSPFKKQRASLPGFEESVRKSLFSKFENKEPTAKGVTGKPRDDGDMDEDEEL